MGCDVKERVRGLGEVGARRQDDPDLDAGPDDAYRGDLTVAVGRGADGGDADAVLDESWAILVAIDATRKDCDAYT